MSDLNIGDLVRCPNCHRLGMVYLLSGAEPNVVDNVEIRHHDDVHTVRGAHVEEIAVMTPPVEAICRCGMLGVVALVEDGPTVWIEHREGMTDQRHSHVGPQLDALDKRIWGG